jgi:hypothetical protein
MVVLRDAKTASYAASFLRRLAAELDRPRYAEAFPRNAVARLDGAGRARAQSRLALSSANVMALSVRHRDADTARSIDGPLRETLRNQARACEIFSTMMNGE